MDNVERGVLEELVDANRILAQQGVLDAFGHVSVRHPGRPDRFLLARNMAPGRVTADDIVELELNGSPVGADDRRLYLERFLHGAIYQARPDVVSVVHSHSPAVLPFTVVRNARLRPVCHMSGFLGAGTPLFDIRDTAGDGTDLLIRDEALGHALAASLGTAHCVLMRGHGSTVVAPTLKLAVYRAVYTEVNARTQWHAGQLGDIEFLTPREAEKTMDLVEGQVDRPWALWRAAARALG